MNKRLVRKNTLESKVRKRIKLSKSTVFIRKDFFDLNKDTDQVGRVLRKLVKEEVLIKIAYGAYVRSKISFISNKPIPDGGDFSSITKTLLKKLGCKVIPTKEELDYNSGKSTQVPTGRVIAVKGRISRKIEYNGTEIYIRQSAY